MALVTKLKDREVSFWYAHKVLEIALHLNQIKAQALSLLVTDLGPLSFSRYLKRYLLYSKGVKSITRLGDGSEKVDVEPCLSNVANPSFDDPLLRIALIEGKS